MSRFIKAAPIADLPASGAAFRTEVRGRMIAVFNVDGTYRAIDDECTHRRGPLSEGVVAAGQVTCPWHGARFDLETGTVLNPPAEKGVRAYNVRMTESHLEIELED